MARPSKPTELKKRTDNPGKRPLNYTEPKSALDPFKPSLSKAAAPIWDELVFAMPPGVFSALDNHILAAYCEAAARHAYAIKKLERGPKEITGSTGQLKLSPWYSEASDAARLLATLGGRLGLDPSARSSIHTGTGSGAPTMGGLIN